jgi:hypothetical protein
LLGACSNNDKDKQAIVSLQAQVGQLQSSLDQTQADLNKTKRSLRDVTDDRAAQGRCLRAVAFASWQVDKALAYLNSDHPGAPAVYATSLHGCHGVLAGGTVASLARDVSVMRTMVNKTENDRTPSTTPTVPSNVTAICNDGSYSYSQNASGTCSWHGGVQAWVNHP